MTNPTIDNDFSLIKTYYDTILNKNKNLVETSNDEPTPIDCVQEMVNKIPEDFWKKKNIKILDPCCGCGNFFIVIYFKLIKYHSKEYILNNILYCNDINTNRLNELKKIFNSPQINIYNEEVRVRKSIDSERRFEVGDDYRGVIDGVNIRGKVVEINGNTVVIMPLYSAEERLNLGSFISKRFI